VQRLAATIDLKSREQEENQKDEKNTMKQSLSVPSPKTLTITDLSHINDPQILAVQEKQAYRINNQQKEAEKKQLIENTTLDVEEEKQRVRNKNLPFAKQDAPFNIQKDSSSELVDNKNHAATMDDDINAEPTAPMQLGYISIDPDFNI
jgi:predicted phage tail protein